MTTTIKTLVHLTLGALLFSSCQWAEDPGPIQEETEYFSEDNFYQIEVGDALRVEIFQDNFFEVRARGDERNLDDLMVYTSGDRLFIRFEDNDRRRHETYVYITLPRLTYLKVKQAANVRIDTWQAEEKLVFDFQEAASGTLQSLVAPEMEFRLSGASCVNVSGETVQMDYVGKEASSLKGIDLFTQETHAVLEGASQLEVTVRDFLKARLDGASLLKYQGNPEIDSEVSGASTLRKY
ncbi:DUF2807 domain-containing protein [Cytophagales bacterium LB-30]|uniref:DUF2807 domain-containing protein n=1 Tax=Shiella aurantiaca TaxID=3058365 RepID=A0ABT8F5J4_9BACT|nr:DUF2807 domain-containing protein [Shiella aurantiaca]MDN4165634.1 DUF2807 domain-containing protein [Shiella aurantiaca]